MARGQSTAWAGVVVISFALVAVGWFVFERRGVKVQMVGPSDTSSSSSLAAVAPEKPELWPAEREPVSDSVMHDQRQLDGEPELAPRRLKYFADCLAQRVRLLASKTAGFVAERLPPGFCQLYPRECAELAAHSNARLGEILVAPDAARLLELVSSESAARSVLRNRTLADFTEGLRGYSTLELEVLRGRRAPVPIEAHLAEFRPFLAEMFARPSEVHALVAEYGAAVIDDVRGGPSDPDQIELRLQELCWEARCRQENDFIEGLDADACFWFHLGRVMTRHVYDDSYWLAPDELAAAELGYPDWLPQPR